MKAQDKVDRLVRAVPEGGAEFAAIRDALDQARHELEQAQTVVAETQVSPIIALHPHIAEEYRRRATELPDLLASTDDDR